MTSHTLKVILSVLWIYEESRSVNEVRQQGSFSCSRTKIRMLMMCSLFTISLLRKRNLCCPNKSLIHR